MSNRSASEADREGASWATETLPLAVRRELLERELVKLGFRRKNAHGVSAGHRGAQHQQHPSSHPQAAADDGGAQHAA